MIRRSFSNEEYRNIAFEMEKYHEIFSTLWNISKPSYSDTIDTAAVSFDKGGNCINFLINYDFWQKLDDYSKEFIVCHEMCHVMLSHGRRAKNYMKNYSADIINVALDLAVNHLLASTFHFNRFFVKDWNKLCWVDTIFKELNLETDKSFEYYITKLPEGDYSEFAKGHGYLFEFDEETEKTLEKTINELHSEEFKFRGHGSVGEPEGNYFQKHKITTLKKPKQKRKWEDVLKKYVTRKDKEITSEHWLRIDRRASFMSKDIILPTAAEIIDKGHYMYNVWLFLDCSGSCSYLKDQFLAASKTFDPKKFDIRKFSRTTEAHEIINDNVYIYGGSDDFRCIENIIQKEIAEKKTRYPDAVFHVTDGHDCSGELVVPQYPQRWHTFLTKASRSTKQWCPKDSNIYYLEEFLEYRDN